MIKNGYFLIDINIGEEDVFYKLIITVLKVINFIVNEEGEELFMVIFVIRLHTHMEFGDKIHRELGEDKYLRKFIYMLRNFQYIIKSI